MKTRKNEEENDIKGKIIAGIYAFIPTSISDYMEDHEDNQEAIINLVMTLKYWTNPEGAYECALSPKDLKEYFSNLQQIVQDPKLILPNANLTETDKEFSRKILSVKLNNEADALILRYHLENIIAERMNTQEKAAEWWNKKSLAEQKAIQQQYNSLAPAQQTYVNQNQYVIRHQTGFYIGEIDPFLYFYMCNNNAHLNYLLLEGTIRAAGFMGRGLVEGVKLGVHVIGKIGSALANVGGGNSGGGGSGGSKCEGDGVLYAIGIAGFIAIISSGIIAGAYALKKMYNSIKNLYDGKKVLRSLYRLAGIGIGGYYGAVGCGALGALFGSFVPGIGTAAGFVLGVIFGSGIGAGIGALVAKYTAKLISVLVYQDENNPSNPEKYKLTEAEIDNLQRKHLSIAVINRMLKAVRREKNKIDIMSSWPWSPERQQKDIWNQQIKLIKSGDDSIARATQIGGRVFNPAFDETGKPYVTEVEVRGSNAIYLQNGIQSSIAQPEPSAPLALIEEQEQVSSPAEDYRFMSLPQPSAPLALNSPSFS